MITSEHPARRGRELRRRYTAADLAVLTRDEARRFVAEGGDPQSDTALAWELLYRLEPDLYERLARAERLHPAILRWLPQTVDRVVEIGAGTGRLTLELVERGRAVVAVEPAGALRQILQRKLASASHGQRARVTPGFLDKLPIASGFADLVVACSVLTPAPAHGGDSGLAEMERVCRPGGRVVIVWPNHISWLTDRNYQYVTFPGPMSMEFTSHREAVELTSIIYPHAVAEVRRRGSRRVPYEVLGVNPPRDLAFKVMAR